MAWRQHVLAAIEGRHGLVVRKSSVVDEFDVAFVLILRQDLVATPDGLFDFLFFVDASGKRHHATSCQAVGRPGDDGCLEGSSCARRYAAESIKNGVSRGVTIEVHPNFTESPHLRCSIPQPKPGVRKKGKLDPDEESLGPCIPKYIFSKQDRHIYINELGSKIPVFKKHFSGKELPVL